MASTQPATQKANLAPTDSAQTHYHDVRTTLCNLLWMNQFQIKDTCIEFVIVIDVVLVSLLFHTLF